MNVSLDIFNKLDSQHIQYVVWKNCNLINDFFEGKENLDIFVDQKDEERFKLTLKNNFWIEVYSTTNNIKNINHFLYIDQKKVFHIHVYFRLITGNSIAKNYDLTDFRDYFKNKFFHPKYNLWIMDYELQLELFKIRMVCKHQSILGKVLVKRDFNNYVNEFNLLYNNSKHDAKTKIDNIEKNYQFFNKEDSAIILNKISEYKKFNRLVSFILEFRFLLKVLFKKLLNFKKFRLKKNVYIFISGADSSGKSTIINDFENLFSNYFKTKKYNIGKPFPEFLGKLLIKNNTKNSNKENRNTNIFISLKNIFLAASRFLYSLLIFKLNFKTNIFLLDRYVSEISGQINGPRLNNREFLNIFEKYLFKIESFFYKLIKPINSEFRLITTIDTCIKRNNQRSKLIKESTEDIIKRHKLFSITKFKSKRVIELENDSNKNKTINAIIKFIIKDLNENY